MKSMVRTTERSARGRVVVARLGVVSEERGSRRAAFVAFDVLALVAGVRQDVAPEDRLGLTVPA